MAINDGELGDIERNACAVQDTLQTRDVLRLVSEVRSLQHQLADPNYLYSGTRIHRQAIICRDAEIHPLREELRKLKAGEGKN